MENIKVKSYMEYNLFFTYGGTYTITYNYASQGAFTNPYELYIDGEKLTHEAYTMAKTSVAPITIRASSARILSLACSSSMAEVTLPSAC